MDRQWKIFLGIIILVVLAVAIYFTFFYYYTVSDLASFKTHQKDCSKTIFIQDINYTTFEYKILGEKSGSCAINVKVLQIKQGTIDKKVLEGKTMTCYLPLKSTVAPESDLTRCHGILREEIQNIMINSCHSQIVANLGKVSEGLEKVI